MWLWLLSPCKRPDKQCGVRGVHLACHLLVNALVGRLGPMHHRLNLRFRGPAYLGVLTCPALRMPAGLPSAGCG